MQEECNELKFKLDDMVGKLNEFVRKTKNEDKDVFGGEDDDKDKPRVILDRKSVV